MRRRHLSFGLAAAAVTSPAAAQNAADVDVLLVLCMDASGSIDAAEFELQRRGYAEAVSNPQIVDALSVGKHKAVAVALVEWGTPGGAVTVVPWMRVHDQRSADLLGKAMIAAARSPQSYNAIGDAVEHSASLILNAPYRAERRLIDVSGDGPDMRSIDPVARARDRAVSVGITINALAIVETGVSPRGESLVAHYERDVIGGPGAFVMVADGRKSFAQAIRAKLVREVSGLRGPTRVVVSSQTTWTWSQGGP